MIHVITRENNGADDPRDSRYWPVYHLLTGKEYKDLVGWTTDSIRVCRNREAALKHLEECRAEQREAVKDAERYWAKEINQ